MVKVHVEEQYSGNVINVWVWEEGPGVNYFLNFAPPNDQFEDFVRTKVSHAEKIPNELKPLIQLPLRYGQDIFRALEEYNRQRGIKPKEQSFVEGKLQATEAHLKDLQDFFRIKNGLNEK